MAKAFKEPKIPTVCIGPGIGAMPRIDLAGKMNCVKELSVSPVHIPKHIHYIPSAIYYLELLKL